MTQLHTQIPLSASGKINVELFPCAGGFAEGFRRQGIQFHLAIEFKPNHCDSYEQNLGHRPVCMDARDFLRMVELGARFDIALFVADPPCTPWSNAGKRLGTEDDRDMLVDTCRLIQLLQPDAYLIGNVPGLDNAKNLHIVQKHIGGLSKHGYCTADYAQLDAADYGVPQHRVRPFWFGHRMDTPCIQWPEPTHGDPKTHSNEQLGLPMVKQLLPWVSCWDALHHLPIGKIGRPVKVKRRAKGGEAAVLEHGSVTLDEDHIKSEADKPARAVTGNTHGDGSVIVFNKKHPPAKHDKPSPTMGAKQRGQGSQVISFSDDMYSPSKSDKPSKTVTAAAGGGAPRTIILNDKHRPVSTNEPAPTIRGGGEGHSAPQTVIMLAPNHAGSAHDSPSKTVLAGDGGGSRRVLTLPFGEPEVAETPTPPIKRKSRSKHDTPQGERVGEIDKPAVAITSSVPRQKTGADKVLEWPWKRPSTTIQADPRIAPPGHHDLDFATRSLPDAVVTSELAGAILQGFPEHWAFIGKSQKERWSQIGQAMPPGLASAVAASVAKQTCGACVTNPVDPPATAKKKKSRKKKQTPNAEAEVTT